MFFCKLNILLSDITAKIVLGECQFLTLLTTHKHEMALCAAAVRYLALRSLSRESDTVRQLASRHAKPCCHATLIGGNEWLLIIDIGY